VEDVAHGEVGGTRAAPAVEDPDRDAIGEVAGTAVGADAGYVAGAICG